MTDDAKRAAYCLAIAGASALALALRWPAIAPSSLWLDDEWVAVLVRDASLRDLVDLAAPVPLGFVVLLKALTAAFGNDPFVLQAVPLLASIALVAATAALAWRITESRAVAATAALFVAGNPVLATYSARVKPFALDALATVLIAWAFVAATRRPSGRALATLGIVASSSLLFSFAALLPGAVFVHVAALSAVAVVLRGHAIASAPLLRGAFYSCAIFDSVALTVLSYTFHTRTDSALFGYWEKCYLPLESIASAWTFLVSKGVVVFAGSVPGLAPRLTAALVAFGVVSLAAKSRTRTTALAIATVYVSLLIASALECYPAGGGRTDLFTHPLSAVLAAASVYALASLLPATATMVRPAIAGLIGVAVVAASGPAVYPRAGDREVIEHAVAHLVPEDTVVIYPWSSWAVALYAGWTVRLSAEPSSTNGFYAVPDRPRTFLLGERREGASFLTSASVAPPQLDALLRDGAPRRIHLIATQTEEPALAYIRDALEARGYVRASSFERDRATFDVFELRSAPKNFTLVLAP